MIIECLANGGVGEVKIVPPENIRNQKKKVHGGVLHEVPVDAKQFGIQNRENKNLIQNHGVRYVSDPMFQQKVVSAKG